MKRSLFVGLVILLSIVVANMFIMGCQTDADLASKNLAKAADQFEIMRRVVFYNGITGEYMLIIEGKLSIKADGLDNQLEVTVKTGKNEFKNII